MTSASSIGQVDRVEDRRSGGAGLRPSSSRVWSAREPAGGWGRARCCRWSARTWLGGRVGGVNLDGVVRRRRRDTASRPLPLEERASAGARAAGPRPCRPWQSTAVRGHRRCPAASGRAPRRACVAGAPWRRRAGLVLRPPPGAALDGQPAAVQHLGQPAGVVRPGELVDGCVGRLAGRQLAAQRVGAAGGRAGVRAASRQQRAPPRRPSSRRRRRRPAGARRGSRGSGRTPRRSGRSRASPRRRRRAGRAAGSWCPGRGAGAAGLRSGHAGCDAAHSPAVPGSQR